jgi:BirA family biotin operon repressor/biotin-[acetyl-CoA-carboxylase] ligase
LVRESAAFDSRAIRAQLGAAQQARLSGLTLLSEADSTNRVLARLPAAERHGHVVLADSQTAGRGRRGRRWHSPTGGNLYLSLGWRFDRPPEGLGLLPLACAVVVARELEALGLAGTGIKWPNDLQADGRKLGGILVESQASGPAVTVVLGVGINVRMPRQEATEAAVTQPWTDLCSHLPDEVGPGLRDRLAGRLIDALLSGLTRFDRDGFAPFQADWQRLDLLCGREVCVTTDSGVFTGTALGLATSGALRVESRSGKADPEVREFLAGEVSVRAARPERDEPPSRHGV